ncbi:transposase [Acetobacter musti]|uniref:Transposase n=1 Tax=Acetobacter musti TaxID=864732 RepID=A0ABX0JXV1_9PROT|nr:transposase [Acetobacter musti]NHN86632.1 transposase [Acetobacter musti]
MKQKKSSESGDTKQHGQAVSRRPEYYRLYPPKKNRKSKPPYNWHLYKKRHLIENMVAKLKDRRRVATRYDRCAPTFMSAIYIAATFIF